MFFTYLLSFVGGAVTVLALEVLGLTALLEPYRHIIQVFFGIH